MHTSLAAVLQLAALALAAASSLGSLSPETHSNSNHSFTPHRPNYQTPRSQCLKKVATVASRISLPELVQALGGNLFGFVVGDKTFEKQKLQVIVYGGFVII